MYDLKTYTKINRSSEKTFGYVFTIFFLILSFLPILYDNEINLIFIFISILLLIITVFYSKLLFYPNKAWYRFGQILSLITSPIIMLLIFVTAFVPTKIFVFFFRKRLLHDKFDNNSITYWEKYQGNKGKMKDQF